jgi:hypothetical protein
VRRPPFRGQAHARGPAVKDRRRRAGIDKKHGGVAAVLLVIEEHINECISHLARCLQRAGVVAVGPDFAVRSQESVHVARDAHAESFHAASEARAVVRLDDHVDVIGLHAELHDAKKAPARGPDLPANAEEERLPAQARQTRANPHGHMQRPVATLHRPLHVGNACPPAPGLAPGARALAAPCTRQRKRKLTHLNRLTYLILLVNAPVAQFGLIQFSPERSMTERPEDIHDGVRWLPEDIPDSGKRCPGRRPTWRRNE